MPINIQKIACGILEENCYIVQAESRDDCVVVDPGDDYPKLKAAIGKRRVEAVLLTHGHFDHIMAAGQLAADFDAPVYVGAADIEMLNDAEKSGYAGMMGVPRANWPPIDAAPFGDAVSACGMEIADLYGGDLYSMIESLKKLFTLPQGVKVYPGHGDATTIGEERARYRL